MTVRAGPPCFARWRNSLSAKLLALLVPPVLILMLLLSWYHNRQEDLRTRDDLRRSMENFATLQATVIAPLLWNLDNFTLRTLFDGYAGIGDLKGVFLFDPDGVLLMGTGTGRPEEMPQIRRPVIVLSQGENRELGQVVVTYSEARLEREGARRRDADMLAFAAMTLVMGLCILLALRIGISRPLQRLLISLGRAADDRVREPVAWHSRDELGRVVESYNRLLAREGAAEDQLKQSEARFRELVEQAPEAILVFDSDIDGSVVVANAQAEKLWGCSRAELLGKKPEELYCPSSPQPDQTCLQESIDTHQRRTLAGETVVFERVVRSRRGIDRVCEVRTALLPDVSRTLVRASYIDITERKAAQDRIEHLATHDPLTNLPNRLVFRERFQQASGQALRTGHKIGLIFIDLDNFKSINDLYGHTVGDSLLNEVACRLTGCMRDADTLTRQGGDEFLVLIAGLASTEAISAIAGKIIERLQLPFQVDGRELSTSASLGIACFPDDSGDFETLLKYADTAMYRSKDAGRNTFRFFDEQMQADVAEHQRIRSGLRRALEQGGFELRYQPQIDLETGAVIGVEALLRWQDPELGQVSPARFIPVAEESGLIVPIGEWVLAEACRQGALWSLDGLPDLVVAVNLSAMQFRRGNLEQSILSALGRSGLSPRNLEIELTESVLLNDTENVLAEVARLQRLGIKLAIDDFGTGYSSLAYLKQFKVDKLKIDQTFVHDVLDDPNDEAIVRAIVQMARSLRLRTIAEGVETPEVLDRLRVFGCDEVQGFYLARPMPGAEIASFIAARPH